MQALRNGVYAGVFADPSWTLKLVEIAPLLAFQFSIDVTRSNHHCGHLGQAPSLKELLPIALPLAQVHEPISIFQQQQSVILKSKSLNVQALAQGALEPGLLGLRFGVSLPFAHVVRMNGRCYLHNGFHRTFGALQAGATHLPVVFRDVADPAAAGIRTDWNTFPVELLESAHPPTVANFHGGGSASVPLRAMTRILHVSWADYAIPDE